MELEDILENMGIELIEIDVTKYILDTFFRVDFKTYENGSFTFELKNNENPSVPSNVINYRGSGIVNGNYINGLNIEFYHDNFTYIKDNSTEATKMTYRIAAIEELILTYL
jgi:hypothetical protein